MNGFEALIRISFVLLSLLPIVLLVAVERGLHPRFMLSCPVQRGRVVVPGEAASYAFDIVQRHCSDRSLFVVACLV